MVLARREFLTGALGASVAGLSPITAQLKGQSSIQYGPFDATTFNTLINICNESYLWAYIADPSNPNYPPNYFANGKLRFGDGSLNWALSTIDSAFQSNGIYNQSYDVSQIPPIGNLSHEFLTYVANQAQISGLKRDYFSAPSGIGLLSDVGVGNVPPISSGSDIQSAIKIALAITAKWANHDYTSLLPSTNYAGPLSSIAVDSAFSVQAISSGDTILQSCAIGAGLTGAGVALINAGGGAATIATVLSGGAVATGSAILAFSGVGLVAVAVGFFVYAGYRLYTQKRGDSGPWGRPEDATTDPPYLERIRSRPSVFPPLVSGNFPIVSSTITYL